MRLRVSVSGVLPLRFGSPNGKLFPVCFRSIGWLEHLPTGNCTAKASAGIAIVLGFVGDAYLPRLQWDRRGKDNFVSRRLWAMEAKLRRAYQSQLYAIVLAHLGTPSLLMIILRFT